MKTDVLRRFIWPWGNVYIFTRLEYLMQFFNVTFRSAAIQIPVDITFFSRVLKRDKLKGRFNG